MIMDKQKMDYWLSKEPSGNYIRVPLNEAKEIAIKALDKAFNTHFISAYIEEKDAAFIDVDEGLFKRAEQKYEARLKHEAGGSEDDEWMQYCREHFEQMKHEA
jgi:hypothetical protein